jgi:hypothetical protein
MYTENLNGQMLVRYADGRVGSGRDPLDVEALFRELGEGDQLDLPLPEGTRIGHMHLYASGLDSSLYFYANLLGFQEGPIFTAFRMGEVGLDEQQPHVVAFNTWKGEGIPPMHLACNTSRSCCPAPASFSAWPSMFRRPARRSSRHRKDGWCATRCRSQSS